MGLGRRGFLGCLAAAGASAVLPKGADASNERREPPEDAVGMLYDTTRCIGCKTCVVACGEANDLAPDRSGYGDGRYDAPVDLNATTANIIQLYKEGGRTSYVKRQCMHCIDPACTAACMIGALQKRDFGVVTWDSNRCIGCRYCEVACPYNVPKFEWNSTNPKIVKCEMCSHRLAEGGIPACCEVCPRDAVIFGKYEDLLAEAKQRLADHPGRYVDRIYGEHEGGGTQVLYLSHVPFEDLQFPDLPDEAVPSLNRAIQHGIYQGFVAPVALYAALGAVMIRNRRASRREAEEGDHE